MISPDVQPGSGCELVEIAMLVYEEKRTSASRARLREPGVVRGVVVVVDVGGRVDELGITFLALHCKIPGINHASFQWCCCWCS